MEEQAIMRIHRIGQKRQVRVRRFIVKVGKSLYNFENLFYFKPFLIEFAVISPVLQDTVEERMQQVQARKERMIAGALTDEEVRTTRIEELKMLFR